MIIEKIHIDAFGKLRDFTLCPSDGLNCIFGKNEDGKTTVMSFIRLMFYGECGKKGDISSNIRRRFAPLSGGSFGGSIDFSHEGISYTLSKQFGRSKKTDRVMLLDRISGKKIALPAEREIGEMLFSLGADAFERSFFIGSLPILGDDGYGELSSKLAAAIYTGDKSDGFTEIDERLSGAAQTYRTPRKAGVSDKLEREIALLRERYDNASERERLRLSLEREREELEKSITSTEQSLAAAVAAEKRSALEKEYKIRIRLRELNESALSDQDLSRAETLLDKLKTTETELSFLLQKNPSENSAYDYSEKEYRDLEKRVKSVSESQRERQASIAELQKSGPGRPNLLLPSILFILGLGAAAASLFLENILFVLALIAAALFIGIGVTVTALKIRSARKDFDRTLSTLIKAEDSLSEELLSLKSRLSAYAERKRQFEAAAERITAEIGERLSAQREKEALLQATKEELCTLLGEGDFSSLLRAARERMLEARSIRSVLDESAYKGISDEELSVLVSSADADYRGEKSDVLSLRLTEQKNELIRRESELKTAFSRDENPAVLEREIKEKEAVLLSQDRHTEALSIAREVLSESYYEMRRSFAPELNRLTAKFFSHLTGGKYSDATVSDEFSVLIKGEGSLPFMSEYLSAGGRDQLDLALRLALSTLIGGEGRLPLLLDDVLIQYDEERAERAFSLISEYAEERQVIFFTCHRHIEALSAKFGAKNLSL